MLPLEQDRARFPGIALLRASAADFGLGGDSGVAVCLGAFLGAALAFGSEAEEGAFSSIFLVYGQGDERVHVTVNAVRDGGHRLVVERVVRGDKNRYLGGLVASMNEDGGEWLVEAAHLGGRPVRASDFLDSIAELCGLTLVAKEVSERLTVVH